MHTHSEKKKNDMKCVLCRSEVGARRLVDFPQFVVCNGDACSERADLFVSVMTNQHNNDDEPDPKRRKLQSETEKYAEENYWSKLPDETWLHIIYHFRNDPETLLAMTETDRRFRSLALAVAQEDFWGSPGLYADKLNEREASLVLKMARDVSEEAAQREEWAFRSIKTFARIVKQLQGNRLQAAFAFIRIGATSLIRYTLLAWVDVTNNELTSILQALLDAYKDKFLDGEGLLLAYTTIADASMTFTEPIEDPKNLHDMMQQLARLETVNWSEATTLAQQVQHRKSSRRALTKLLLHHGPAAYRTMDDVLSKPIPEIQARKLYGTPDVNSTLRWYAGSLWGSAVTPQKAPSQMRQILRAYKVQLDAGAESKQLRQDFRAKMATFVGVSPWDYFGASYLVFSAPDEEEHEEEEEEEREWTDGAMTLLNWIVEERIGDQVLFIFTLLNSALAAFTALDVVYSALTTNERAEVDLNLRQQWQFKHDHNFWTLYPGVNDIWLLQHDLLPGFVPYNIITMTGSVYRQALDDGRISLDTYLKIWLRAWQSPRLTTPVNWWRRLGIVERHSQLSSHFPLGIKSFWTWIIENKPWLAENAIGDLEFIRRLLVLTANDQLQLVREKLSASMDVQTIQTTYGWPLLEQSNTEKNAQWPALIVRYFFG